MSNLNSRLVLVPVVLLVLIVGSAPCAFAVGSDGIYIPWVKSFCGANTMVLEAEVCNQAAQQRGFWVEFVDHGPFSGCDVSVVPQHAFLTNLPLLLAPGECATVRIEIAKPSELMAHPQVCYWLRFTPDIGGTITLGGYLTDNVDLCFEWWIAEPVVFLHPETPVTGGFEVFGIQPRPFHLLYLLQAYADIDVIDNDLVSIDGMPPGDAAFGEGWIPGGEWVAFSHTIEWLADEPLRFIDLVVLDESTLAPLASIGLHQMIEAPSDVLSEPPPARVARGGNVRVSPNPSRGPTAILWESNEPAPLQLQIHDAAGRQVRSLDVSPQGPGPQRVAWDGRNDKGVPVSAGAYWVRFPGAPTLTASKVLIVR